MDMSEPHQRLAAARLEAGYQTASEAARAYGWNENTYRSHENGERGIKSKIAEKYARAFGVSSAYILVGSQYKTDLVLGSISLPISGDVDSLGKVKIKGLNLKPSEVDYYAVTRMNFYENVLAIEVSGEEIFEFLSRGDLIILNKKMSKMEDVPGRLCYIEDEKANGYLRFLRIGSKANYVDIQTSPRKPELLIKPDVVATVAAIIPRGEWQKESPAEHARWGETDPDDN